MGLVMVYVVFTGLIVYSWWKAWRDDDKPYVSKSQLHRGDSRRRFARVRPVQGFDVDRGRRDVDSGS